MSGLFTGFARAFNLAAHLPFNPLVSQVHLTPIAVFQQQGCLHLAGIATFSFTGALRLGAGRFTLRFGLGRGFAAVRAI